MDLHTTHAVIVPSDTPLGLNRAQLARAGFLARYRNDHTRRGYSIALNQWFRWCDQHGLDPLDAQRAHIELFARELELTGRLIVTVSGKLNALAGFYRMAFHDGLITVDPMAHVVRPKIKRVSTRESMTQHELARVLQVAETRGNATAYAFLCVLAYNGLRNSEATGIDVEHIGEDRGQMTARIIRKGGDRQDIAFSWITADAIKRLLLVHRTRSGPLFTTSTGNRLDRRSAARIVTRCVAEAGIGKHITPHSFRRTWCTLALDAGVPDRDVQIAGGWSDSRMVSYYDAAREDIRRGATVTHGVTAWVEAARAVA